MAILVLLTASIFAYFGYLLLYAGLFVWSASKRLPARKKVARASVGLIVLFLGLITVVASSMVIFWVLALALTSPTRTPKWAADAQANTSERHQVIRFKSEIQGGQRIDRDDPYLPLLDEEARHGRAENFDRCRVAVATYNHTGQVVRVGFDDSTTLFTVRVRSQRWLDEGADEVVLEDLACFFAAGDVRRKVRFPVLDEHGRPMGEWRYGRYVADNLSQNHSN